MKYLWSPWRMKYIEKESRQEGCIFCDALAKQDGQENLVVMRGEQTFVMLNRFPYTSGHLMVVPFEHRPTLEALDPPTRAEMMELVSESLVVLRSVYVPQAFNVGANIGEVAGAGIPEHVHMHIVPRWAGDTSFMTTVGNSRVLPESLEETYQRVRQAWLERRAQS
jgi:ATP adenylyltransferase